MQAFIDISDFYNKRVDQYGHNTLACDYGNANSQIKKFEVLSKVIDLNGLSLLDIGCGFADYSTYLETRFKDITYEGYDISEKMIESARLLKPKTILSVKNIIDDDSNVRETHDIVTANGIFYLLGADAQSLMVKLVKAMYKRAKIAIAFNSLSSWSDKDDSNEFKADPVETIEWCKRITPWVTLRHDYMPHDFTVYMYKEQFKPN